MKGVNNFPNPRIGKIAAILAKKKKSLLSLALCNTNNN